MNATDQSIQAELRKRMGVPDGGLRWVYTCDSIYDKPNPCWELVESSNAGSPIIGFREHYTNVLVFPSGRLKVDDNVVIQCASVEEAKELGMTTYLLAQEGG
jgi:hypothetical protein